MRVVIALLPSFLSRLRFFLLWISLRIRLLAQLLVLGLAIVFVWSNRQAFFTVQTQGSLWDRLLLIGPFVFILRSSFVLFLALALIMLLGFVFKEFKSGRFGPVELVETEVSKDTIEFLKLEEASLEIVSKKLEAEKERLLNTNQKLEKEKSLLIAEVETLRSEKTSLVGLLSRIILEKGDE